MNNLFCSAPTTRREFLKIAGRGLGFIAFAGFAPEFLTNSVLAGNPLPERDRTVLVLIQLAGGNDGLNTLIPFEDDNYYKLRPSLCIKKTDTSIHKISDLLALHPSCGAFAELFKNGHFGIIQNVGYPNPNRSHFRSTEIWETGVDSQNTASSGWLGRYFDNCCAGAPGDPVGIHATNIVPQSFFSEKPQNVFGIANSIPARGKGARRAGGQINPGAANGSDLSAKLAAAPILSGDTLDAGDNAHYLQHVLMDALVTESRVQGILANYRPAAEYPATALGQSLRRIAALIASGMETRVYYAAQGGYDTHANQLGTHARNLRELSEAMAAFQNDLEARKIADQVLTMTFSEFGRRPSENSTGGTDHGTAAPLFVMGSRIQKTLLGTAPDLALEKNRDIAFSTDFRQVYATVLHRWLNADAGKILFKQKFGELDFLK